jgi:hypothetical protein
MNVVECQYPAAVRLLFAFICVHSRFSFVFVSVVSL